MITSRTPEVLTDAEAKMLETAGYIADHRTVSNMSTSRIILSACEAHKMRLNMARLYLLSNYFDTGVFGHEEEKR